MSTTNLIAKLTEADYADLAELVAAESFQRTVTYEDFDAALARVLAGKSMFWVSTYARHTPIKAKNIQKFKDAGYELIAKSKDGKNFTMQQGKSRVKVLAGYLFETEIR